jgi:DNA-binding response OmpR family regulator
MRLAVVEDDRALCARVAGAIRSAGHNCYEFHSSDALRRSLRRESYDLVIVDEKLTDAPSDDLLEWMRNSMSWAPAVILLSQDDSRDQQIARRDPADGYVRFPGAIDQIGDQIDAVLLKRFSHADTAGLEFFGDYAFDSKARTIARQGTNIAVTAKEFSLALLFFRNFERPLSRAHVMEAVWGRLLDQGSRTLDAHVSQIRNRLGLTPENGLRLVSIYGFGYRLERC